MGNPIAIPSVSVTYAQDGRSTRSNELGMRPMQERAYQKRGEQYLLIKSPPASGKSRALMFIALDKLEHQGLRQAIVVVPEKAIGSSFQNEPLSEFGFWADWRVEPRWNLCNAPGTDGGKVDAVKKFLESEDKVLVCTHATFRFAVEKFGVEVLDDRLIAVDEFHHVSANPDNKLGDQMRQLMTRDKTHIVAMTGSYFRGDAEAVLHPEDESRFETVTYTYYEQLNGYQYLKQLDIGYYFYSGSYTDLLGNVAKDGGYLILNSQERTNLDNLTMTFVRPMFGGQEFIKGINRYCIWVTENDFDKATQVNYLKDRFEKVKTVRNQSPKKATVQWSNKPYRFVEIRSPEYIYAIIIPRVSSENRSFLPVGLLPPKSIVTEAFALYDAPLWNMALIASRLHLVWIATVCGKLETRYRYSNTLGWNTFPVPTLTTQNKTDLTRCAEEILLAREHYFPATIADMYDPDRMDKEFPLVREAHDRNDETIERIYIGRRFKNDTERLEKLFEMYTKMTSKPETGKKISKRKNKP